MRSLCLMMLTSFFLIGSSLEPVAAKDYKEKVIKTWTELKGFEKKTRMYRGALTAFQCAVFITYRTYQRTECSQVVLGGACALPGARRVDGYDIWKQTCPRVCKAWTVTGTRTERVKEVVKDCVPLL